MAKHDESDLRVVEVKGSLPVQQMRRPVPAMPKRHPAPTRAEALKALRSMKGAASVIERIPMLGDTTSWNEFGFWSMRIQTGAALGASGGSFVWNCDFIPGWEMTDAYTYTPLHVEGATGAVFFAGPAEQAPGPLVLEPPAELSGQVWCYMDVPVGDFDFLFVAQVFTYDSGDPPEDNPDYTATIEWGIDTSVFGTLTLPLTSMSGGVNHPFLVRQLSSGLHRFVIKQVTGGVYFVSLTAWTIPVLPHPRNGINDESELRIVEVKGSLPLQQMRRPVPAMPKRHPAPTRAEALKVLRSMKGAASVIERIPMLGDTTSWNEVAFWGIREETGAALSASGGIFVWYCDFTPSFDMGFAYSHPPELGLGTDIGEVFFAGVDLLEGPGGSVEPPAESLSGQVWCYMDVPYGPNGRPVSNFYLFVAQVATSSDPATIEWGINTSVLGTVNLFTGGVLGRVNYPFLVQLSSGSQRFVIKQVTGAMLFQSLTAWQIPNPVIVTGS